MLLSRSLKLVVLGLALIAGGCDRQTNEESQPRADAEKSAGAPSGTLDRAQVGKEVPKFLLSDASGKSLDLQTLKGTPLLINLWATWCAPCIVELPMLDEIAGDREGDLRVLTVSQDMNQTEKVGPFLAERGLDRLEPWLDPKSNLTFELGAQTLPTTILYDAKGREVWRYIGGNDWTSTESAQLLDEANPARVQQ